MTVWIISTLTTATMVVATAPVKVKVTVVGARIVIGLVLLVAGVTKVRSRNWPVRAREMGTPKAAIVLLPVVEVTLGLALISQLAAAAMAWVATALFLVFTAVVAVQLRSPAPAPCNCFGANSDRPVNGWTLARNLVLVLLALLATGFIY